MPQVPLRVSKVDMSSSLRRWAESGVVHQIANIKRAFVVRPKSDDGDVLIKTDGVNISAMFQFSKFLDLSRLYCNDVHAMASQYGVEAASQVIVKVHAPALVPLCSCSIEFNVSFINCRKCATSSRCTALRSTCVT